MRGSKPIDLTDLKISHITVEGLVQPRPSNLEDARWFCRCRCGKELLYCHKHLMMVKHKKGSISCGCRKRKSRLCAWTFEALLQSQVKSALKNVLWGARARGLTFELQDEDFGALIQMACFYCGFKPSRPSDEDIETLPYKKLPKLHVGLYRTNSDIGYRLDNVVPCCRTCNLAKSTMTISEFYAWVDRLAKHQSYAPLWNQQPIWEEWDYERVREPNTLRAIPLDFSQILGRIRCRNASRG